jgi:hypothetical protein
LQDAERKKHQKEEKLAKGADIQLQNDFNMAKTGNTKTKPSSRLIIRKILVIKGSRPCGPEVVAEASTTVSSRGRKIRLLHRFRDI